MDSLFPNLKKVMKTSGVSIEDLADAIDIDKETVLSKMRRESEWTLSEAIAICRYLHYPDLRNLFLR